jgi:hypothetical protein
MYFPGMEKPDILNVPGPLRSKDLKMVQHGDEGLIMMVAKRVRAGSHVRPWGVE